MRGNWTESGSISHDNEDHDVEASSSLYLYKIYAYAYSQLIIRTFRSYNVTIVSRKICTPSSMPAKQHDRLSLLL